MRTGSCAARMHLDFERHFVKSWHPNRSSDWIRYRPTGSLLHTMARCEYLDNQKVQQITETIRKGKKIQLAYLQKETAAGHVPQWEPPPARQARTMMDTAGVPAFTSRYCEDPELFIATSISKNMWTSNPGYVLRDGPHLTSSTHTAYAYDTEAVAFIKMQGEFNKQHHKRRDEFSSYVEAAAKAHHQLGSRPSAVVTGGKK